MMSLPAFGNAYSGVGIAAVASYVVGRFGSKQSKVSEKDGSARASSALSVGSAP